jgi:putative phosphoesterase
MRIGIFADSHDHLDNIRQAVDLFNRRDCGLVVFAGDLVSTFAIPPLRRLNCPMIASFGDNEGNKVGIRGGMQIIGPVGEPPFGFRAADGTRILLTHQRELLRGQLDGAQVVIYAHTHRPRIGRDSQGRLWINPGETSGWTFGDPTVVILETRTGAAELVRLAPGVRA